MPLPRRQVAVALPPRVWEQLAAKAAATGVTVDALIQRAIKSDLRRAALRRRRSRP
jgi:post-segregation antitoxin (ccd killing protein)